MRATTALLLVAASLTACSSSSIEPPPGDDCPAGTVSCGGECVSAETDDRHCGGCGSSCAAGESCVAGSCLPACARGETRCGADCVSLDHDDRHCGGCGTACDDDEFCDDGSCMPSCAPGLTMCGQTADECRDLDSDASNCGECGNACAQGSFCMDGSCLTSCEGPGLEVCWGTCVNTRDDDRNCGACGIACAAGAACEDGACACPDGQEICDGACVDLSSDAAHCGACRSACASGASCVDRACACPDGQEECEGACVDTSADDSNCGACGDACPDGLSCEGGACLCPGGREECEGACVDTSADGANCGACGIACPAGTSCEAGACACSGGLALCDEACADLDSDRAHCGACGNACVAGARSSSVCVEGECLFSCAAPYLDCDGEAATGCEVDPTSDAAHCGGCGLACAAGQVCTEGLCCAPGEIACGGACVDPLANGTNCGACGLTCQGQPDSTGGACVDGRCELACAPLRGDCNADVWDGCEHDLSADRGNCGACGNGCGALCGGGACVAVTLPAGLVHTSCALSADGRVYCWGQNYCGQVGNAAPMANCRNVPTYSGVSTPTLVPQLGAATSLYAGEFHTCAIEADGGAKCWGANDLGQLGAGDAAIHQGPVAVMDGAAPLAGVTALALTDSSTCALVAGGVKCWGNGANGRLGDAAAGDSLTPVPVTADGQPLAGVVAIAAGKAHVCARLQSGSVACWGADNYGQLGNGAGSDQPEPAVVAGLSGVDQIVAAGYVSCARTGGAVKCWGQNTTGQIGDGANGGNRPTPTDVLGVSTAVSITAAQNHACALLAGGGAMCWGLGSFGQLGNGVVSFIAQPTPSAVIDELTGAPRQDIRSLAAGGAHTCMITDDDTAWCWGMNLAGQAGDGTLVNVTSPTKVVW